MPQQWSWALLEKLRERCGEVTLLDHWKQGEFHHDVVLRVREPGDLPGPILVVSTNCNGGIKEVLCFAEVPDRWALWKHRCPDNPDFEGALPAILGSSRTHHWFEPCELLTEDARSELRPPTWRWLGTDLLSSEAQRPPARRERASAELAEDGLA